VYWIEYVAKHQVGLMLKPAFQDQWYEHYLLDVVAVLTVVAVTIAYLTGRVIIALYRLILI
jgi:hypothetical protein